MPLIDCPECGKQTFDTAVKRCRRCGRQGTSDFTINEQTLAGFLHAVQMQMIPLQPEQFQQILGVFGRSVVHPDDPGIPLDDWTADRAREHLMKNGILCCRIDFMQPGYPMQISLVVAHTQTGIDRCHV